MFDDLTFDYRYFAFIYLYNYLFIYLHTVIPSQNVSIREVWPDSQFFFNIRIKKSIPSLSRVYIFILIFLISGSRVVESRLSAVSSSQLRLRVLHSSYHRLPIHREPGQQLHIAFSLLHRAPHHHLHPGLKF